MAITLTNDRQTTLFAYKTFDFTALTAAGVTPMITLPVGAIPVSAFVDVQVKATGGADITLEVSGAGCVLAAFDADTAASVNVVACTHTALTAQDNVDITLAGTTATGGSGVIGVTYVVAGRANELI